MSLKVDIQKKDLWLISAVFVFLVGVGLVVGTWDAQKTMFHDGNDVKVFFNGSDRSVQEAFNIINAGGEFGGGGMAFGEWVPLGTVTSTASPHIDISATEATSDGFLIGEFEKTTDVNGCGELTIIGYTDGNSNPLTEKARAQLGDANEFNLFHDSWIMPVKSGESYKVVKTGCDSNDPVTRKYYWIPIVSSGVGSSGGTPGNCAWKAVTWNTNNFCPVGKVVQGIDTCPRDGNRDVCSLYCCDIV